MRNFVYALAAALALVPGATLADEPPDLHEIADLEALVLRCEKDGWKRLPLEKLVPKPPALVFVATGNTIEKEKEFRTKWIAAYRAYAEDLIEQATALAKADGLAKEKDLALPPDKRISVLAKKLKKTGAAAEIARTIEALAPRYLEVLKLAADPAEKATFELRDKETKKFLKRYDFGPKVATAEAAGTAILNVQLAPDTYDLVKRTVYGWKFTPLKDEKGAGVKLGDKRIEYTDQLAQSDVREGLRMLGQEYFTVRYSRWEKERELDIMKITGAKLLFGTYYVIEHEDRIVVAREPAAK